MMTATDNGAGTSLTDLFDGIIAIPGSDDVEITGVTLDSSRLRRGDLFLACAGDNAHGLDWVGDAVARGAAAVAWEPVTGRRPPELPAGVPRRSRADSPASSPTGSSARRRGR